MKNVVCWSGYQTHMVWGTYFTNCTSECQSQYYILCTKLHLPALNQASLMLHWSCFDQCQAALATLELPKLRCWKTVSKTHNRILSLLSAGAYDFRWKATTCLIEDMCYRGCVFEATPKKCVTINNTICVSDRTWWQQNTRDAYSIHQFKMVTVWDGDSLSHLCLPFLPSQSLQIPMWK